MSNQKAYLIVDFARGAYGYPVGIITDKKVADAYVKPFPDGSVAMREVEYIESVPWPEDVRPFEVTFDLEHRSLGVQRMKSAPSGTTNYVSRDSRTVELSAECWATNVTAAIEKAKSMLIQNWSSELAAFEA